jgi:hypothetical protein
MSRRVVVTPSGRTYDFGLVYLKQKLGEMDEVVSVSLMEGLTNDLALLGRRGGGWNLVCTCEVNKGRGISGGEENNARDFVGVCAIGREEECKRLRGRRYEYLYTPDRRVSLMIEVCYKVCGSE